MTILKIVSAFVCGFMACLCWQFFRDCGVEPQVKKQIPSLIEIQKMVGAKPDGIYGHETQTKWEEAYGNQSANVCMTPTGRPK